jgi:hypothetical protein
LIRPEHVCPCVELYQLECWSIEWVYLCSLENEGFVWVRSHS